MLILPRIQNQSEQLASNYVNIQISHFHFFSFKKPYNCNFKTNAQKANEIYNKKDLKFVCDIK